MIKANELQIGDWVSCDGKNYQIAEIGGMVCLDADNELFASFEDIQPVPLTPEILEKNGFTKENGLYYWTQEKDGKTIAGAYYWVDEKYINIAGYEDDGVTISCHYVHTLQHALKLCGIDKEITL